AGPATTPGGRTTPSRSSTQPVVSIAGPTCVGRMDTPMAMHVGGSRGGPVSEINVTPLVDIMLVLLIIMMLVAPLLDGAPVALPEARHTVPKPDTQKQTVVHVTAAGALYVDNVAVSSQDLVGQVTASIEHKPDRVVYLKADADASYRAV